MMFSPLVLRVYTGFFLAAGMLFCSSCEQTTPPPNNNTPGSSEMRVIAEDETSVTIHFPQSSETQRQAYRIIYKAIQSDESYPSDDFVPDSGSVFVGSFGTNYPGVYLSTVILDLQPQLYEFTLHIVNDMYESLPAYDTARGAPAARFVNDVSNFGVELRLYERNSSMRTCLVLNPDLDAPTTTDVANAPDGNVVLALLVNDEVTFGTDFITVAELVVSGLVEANIPSSNADLTTLLIDHIQYSQARTLDSFEIPYSDFIRFGTGTTVNSVKVSDPSSQLLPENQPLCVLARFGTLRNGTVAPTFRWVRILIRADSSGKRLQGTKPNRYIELEVSVGHPGVPFA